MLIVLIRSFAVNGGDCSAPTEREAEVEEGQRDWHYGYVFRR